MMTHLDSGYKRLIVIMPALGNSPADVAEMVAGKFLVQGTVDEGAIQCPWQGAPFDLETGEAVGLRQPRV